MDQHHCTDTIDREPRFPGQSAPGRLWLAWLAGRLRGVPDRMRAWRERSRQRRRLDMMDERMLRDIGLSRAAASAETSKWFWQP